MSEQLVVVVSGGEAPRPESAVAVPIGAPVIAADRGLDHARALGLAVTAVVGDLDSVDEEQLTAAEAAGTRVVRHPAEKDATDLELALEEALRMRPTHVLVLAGDGGRLDHLLGTMLLLGSARYADVQVDAEIGDAGVHVIRGERVLSGAPGETVSLLALHGDAEGVTTDGLQYPLDRETLEAGSTRGISNVFVSDTATVTLERGVLLAIQPRREEPA
jgi:thiamine pyrophosphokinase